MTKRQSWRGIVLSLLATSLLFTACKRNYSKDDPIPTVYSPSLIVGSDNQVVYALNPADGTKNWELALPSPVIASPILYNGMVYIANSTRDTIYKVNAKTGEMIKKITFFGSGAGITATPIADANLLYVPTLGGSLFAIDTGTYETKWAFTPGTGGMKSSPTLHNSRLYLATTGGHVYAIDKTTGITVSGSPFWDFAAPTATSFISSPAVADPYLYIGGANDSTMYCIYLDSTASGVAGLRWTYKTQGNIMSSPAAYAGNVIFGCSDFRVYCLDSIIDPVMGQFTPEARWIDSMHSEITSSPYASNQVVYVGCKDYRLYALNIINGAHKWEFASNGVITSSPVVYNGTVYIGSFDKSIYALDSARGTMKWFKDVNGQVQCSPVIDDFSKTTGYNSQVSGYTN